MYIFNYSQGFRVPTFFELFPAVGLSNPNLKPVTSDNFEIGGKTGLWNWGEASLSLFRLTSETRSTSPAQTATCSAEGLTD